MEEAVAAVCTVSKTRIWVHELNVNRELVGEYHVLMEILEKDENSDRFQMYFRMKREQFQSLHDLIKDKIRKIDTTYRKAIGTKERLAVCLR